MLGLFSRFSVFSGALTLSGNSPPAPESNLGPYLHHLHTSSLGRHGQAVVARRTAKAVARRYSVSEYVLGRHKKHMQLVITKAATVVEQKDLAYGSALLAEISRITANAERLQIKSERRQNVRGALRGIHDRSCPDNDCGTLFVYNECRSR